jgi:hypothetical protein
MLEAVADSRRPCLPGPMAGKGDLHTISGLWKRAFECSSELTEPAVEDNSSSCQWLYDPPGCFPTISTSSGVAEMTSHSSDPTNGQTAQES